MLVLDVYRYPVFIAWMSSVCMGYVMFCIYYKDKLWLFWISKKKGVMDSTCALEWPICGVCRVIDFVGLLAA